MVTFVRAKESAVECRREFGVATTATIVEQVGLPLPKVRD